MDKCTFSNTPAAQNLIKILEKESNPKIASRVAKFVSKYSRYLGASTYIPDKTVRESTLLMWRGRFINHVEKMELPQDIKTYILNIMAYQFRKCMKEGQRIGNSEKRRNRIKYGVIQPLDYNNLK